MKLLSLVAVLPGSLIAGAAIAQTPPAPPSPSPSPVTEVEPFPSPPHWLRAHPGPVEDSWYVYGAGFQPRTSWVLVEALCSTTPCDHFGASASDVVKEDGTLSFYIRLPRVADPEPARLLAALQEPISGGGIPGDAPFTYVAGHNPGPAGNLELDLYGGYGYAAGTTTGIAAVDEVVALSQAHGTAALLSRLVLKDGTSMSGEPVHGLATWQCGPFMRAEDGLDEWFEYPAGLVYAVFNVPRDPALPLRYEGAAYGIAWYDGGTDIPLGGLTLVSAEGRIVGTEIRCGTTPGYHVHDFGDWILRPFDAPAPPPQAVTPSPPDVGSGRGSGIPSTPAGMSLFAVAVLFATFGTGAAVVLFRPRR